MSTKKVKKSVKCVKRKTAGVRDVEAHLVKLAHSGTKEAVDHLREFIQNEKDEDLRDYAEIALEEAEFNYYSPQNDQEEEDFLLARSICRRQERLWALKGKVEAARLELKELGLNRRVHQEIIEGLTDKEKINEWQYNFSEDYWMMIKQREEELTEEIAYETAWLEQARWLIKTKKYQVMPQHIFDHIHFDADACTLWEDETESTGKDSDFSKGLINYIDNPK